MVCLDAFGPLKYSTTFHVHSERETEIQLNVRQLKITQSASDSSAFRSWFKCCERFGVSQRSCYFL